MSVELPERFWSKVQQSGDCWVWAGSLSQSGYGQFRFDGRTSYPHRLTYAHFIGPIGDGLVTDHLCRNRACCNPWHLEAVPQRINLLRGVRTFKSDCVNGHPTIPENRRFSPSGKTWCRLCVNEAAVRLRRQRSEMAVAA